MRYLQIIFMVSFFMFITASVSAQMYQYRDAEGNIRFTDDLGNVPAHLREDIVQIQGVPSTPPRDDWHEPPTQIEGVDWDAEDGFEADSDLFEMGEALRREQDDIRNEYNSIEEAKASLGDPPGQGASRREFEEYAKKVNEINNRITDYQKRLETHEKRVTAYNARFVE